MQSKLQDYCCIHFYPNCFLNIGVNMEKELTENIFNCLFLCVEFITNVAITTCLHCFYGAEGGAWQHNERGLSCYLMTTTDLSNKTFFLINNPCFHFDICKILLIYFFLKITLVKGFTNWPQLPVSIGKVTHRKELFVRQFHGVLNSQFFAY